MLAGPSCSVYEPSLVDPRPLGTGSGARNAAGTTTTAATTATSGSGGTGGEGAGGTGAGGLGGLGAGQAGQLGSDAAGGSTAGRDSSVDRASPAMDASTLDRTVQEASPETACRTPASIDYCATLPALGAAPIIDGELDCGLELRAVVPVGWSGGANINDTSTEYAAAWRSDGIYVYVLVRDPALIPADPVDLVWKGDAVEIYVDNDASYVAPPPPIYDEPGTRQIVISSPSAATPVARTAQLFSNGNADFPKAWTSTAFGAFARPDGYAVEAFVRPEDLGLSSWSLVAGGVIGLDLSIDVSQADAATTTTTDGHRAGQYFLHIDPALAPPYWDPRTFCTPVLAQP